MNSRDNQKKLRRPEVNVADQPAKRDEVANGLYGLCGLIRRGDVIEHFENARHAQHEHQEYSCSPRAEVYRHAIVWLEWSADGDG